VITSPGGWEEALWIIWICIGAVASVTFATTAFAANDEFDCISGSDNDQRIAACTRVLENPRLPSRVRWVGHLSRGEAYDQKGDDTRAIADFSDAIRLNPKSVLAYNKRALTYTRKGEFDRAISDLNAAIGIAPKFAHSYFARGSAYFQKGESIRAIPDLDKVIQIVPANTRSEENITLLSAAYSIRAFAYSDMRKYDQALSDLNQAIRLKSDEDIYYSERCQTRIFIAQELQEALADSTMRSDSTRAITIRLPVEA
jgi:tetratricopeptide (TPR) repeat protein